MLLGDEKNTYTDSQTSFLGLDSYVSLLKIYGDVSDDLAAPYDYVMVPGYGADSDYEGIDVTGKIAVVQRGGTDENGEPITFVTKIQNALWKNAIGILVYNNDTEHPDDSSIPTIEGKGDYASMSGTSMASPYVAGASVLVKSYMAENWTGSYDAASMTENLMMSTASPVVDPETKLPYSPVCRAAASLTCPPPPPAMWYSTPMPTSTATPSPCWIWGTMLPRTAATA